MDRSTVMCLIFFIGLGAHAILAAASTPAYAWSNTEIFSHPETTVNSVVHPEDLSVLFGNENGQLSKYVNAAAKPELVFLFVEDKLSSAHAQVLVNSGALPHVQSYISSSTSSLLAPIVSGDLSVSSLLSSLPSSSSTIFVGQTAAGNAQSMTVDELLAQLQSPNFAIAHNGVTDVVVVALHAKTVEQFTSDDALIARIESAVGSVSHVGILVSSQAHHFERSAAGSFGPYTFERHFLQTNNSNSTTTNATLFPDGIVAGLIVMLPFLLILAIAITCACNLQSELRFDGEKLKKQ